MIIADSKPSVSNLNTPDLPLTDMTSQTNVTNPPPPYSDAATGSSTNAVEDVSNDSNLPRPLDPTLHIPNSLLPDTVSGLPESQRDNLNIWTSLGGVDATLRFISSNEPESQRKCRAKVTLETALGSIQAKIVEDPRRPRFLLNAYTSAGSMRIRIPRSFVGHISASTAMGTILLSSEVKANATVFSDGNATKCFVGDFSQYHEDQQEEWDELKLSTSYGSIVIGFIDKEENSLGARQSFWGRIFG
ncbi:hypothetical protein ONZ45_g3937 [Pleurotus djamor]|nr:hypothetical protein ONZ45_g3937 [Pleurotus djamor]